MFVWRINREIHNPLSGEGARLHGARWNRKGVPVVYTALNPALAVLEMLVHIDPEGVPDDLRIFRIRLPDDTGILEIKDSDLPSDWKEEESACLNHLESAGWQSYAAIKVPSAIIDHDFNLILNPAHEDFKQVNVYEKAVFMFDSRLPGFRKV